jgi:RimJ/RimL family protein N-acetyltransferase
MVPVFETARLIAREYELSDAEASFEIYGDAAVMEFIGPKNVKNGRLPSRGASAPHSRAAPPATTGRS